MLKKDGCKGSTHGGGGQKQREWQPAACQTDRKGFGIGRRGRSKASLLEGF